MGGILKYLGVTSDSGAEGSAVSNANAGEVTASRDAATSPMALRSERSFMPTFASVAKMTAKEPLRKASSWCGRVRGKKREAGRCRRKEGSQ